MKRHLLLIVGLMITTIIFAAPVTRDRAKENVLSFLKSKSNRQMYAAPGLNNAQIQYVNLEVEDNAYYVYNIGDNAGFVIASGDDCANPVLGYSYEGSFDPENIPSNMKAWLDGYVQQIKFAKSNTPAAPHMLASTSKHIYKQTIPTMITSRWNQDAPFNDKCPDFNQGKHRPTGCVATAMSQVLYYHKWPKDVIGEIPGYEYYDDPNLGGNGSTRELPALPGVKFEWDKMLDKYTSTSSKESRIAVATLMRYVGASVEMNYCPYASGAHSNDIPYALRTYLGYDKGVKYLDSKGFTTFEWEDVIYNELANNRPVLYSGTAPGIGGHQFVCDGYENEYFHFNWGWGGMSDGFFKIDALSPEQQGIGGAGNGMHFSENHHIVIGVQPPVEGSVEPIYDLKIGSMSLAKNYNGEFKKSNLGSVTLYLNSRFAYDGEKDLNCQVGFGLFDVDNKLVSVVKNYTKKFWAGFNDNDSEINGAITIKAEDIENDGTYYLKAIVCPNGSDWLAIENSDKIYFKIEVNGEQVKLTSYPLVNVQVTNLRYEGFLYQEAEVTLKAEIINLGEDINATLYLSHNKKIETSVNQPLSLKKGEKKEVEFVFSPIAVDNETGEDYYGMAINGIEYCEQAKGTFIKSETKSANLDFQPVEGFTSEGNYFDIPVKITNKSSKNPYKCLVRAILYQKSGYEYKRITSVLVPAELEPSGTTNIDVHFDNLKFNNLYHLGFSFYNYGREKQFGGLNQHDSPNKVFSTYKVADALVYYDESGNMDYKVIAEGETFDIPENACFVELPKTVKGRTFNKNSNPNCIYKLKKGVSVSSLSDSNIIKDSYAFDIKLSDTHPFYSKETINTTGASVTVNVEKETTTLWLPFIPETATVDGVALMPGSSVEDMESADYTLIPFVAEEEAAIYCDFIQTNSVSPCVLKVNSKYVGKSIEFSTTSEVNMNLNGILKGTYFNVNVSNNTSEFAEPVYGFGITEFSNDAKKVAPFRVYLTSVSSDAAKVKVVYPEVSAGIEGVEADDMIGKIVNIYSVDGVMLRTTTYGDKMLEGLPSGIYIVNGKKFVK